MKTRFPVLVGAVFIVIGFLSLALNVAVLLLGRDVFVWGGWQLWPIILLGMGALFVVAPLVIRRRGLGGLFIPGALIVANGAILAYTSTFSVWSAREWL